MALTGLQIYKYLPKTNCKKCGFPTCLSFAMAIAQKKVSLDKCPDITAEAEAILASAAEPPMALVTVGDGERKLEFGGETVLFRHEKTFYHMPQLMYVLPDSLSEEEFTKKVEEIEKAEFERVGKLFRLNLILLENESKNPEVFLGRAKILKERFSGFAGLSSESGASLEKVLSGVKLARPVLFSADKDNCKEFAALAVKYETSLAVTGHDLAELGALVPEIVKSGTKNIFLFPKTESLRELLHFNTSAWRLALKKNDRSFGFPIINYAGKDFGKAATAISKYGSIILLEGMKPEAALPLITLALNIYTDPQKPIMMEAKLYEVGRPSENSPVLVTTNFSLTFFSVQPEIENSKIPAWLVITDSEGMSVLTAWAADKFNPEIIKKAVEKGEVAQRVKNKKIIIPGYVAVMKAKLEEELPGWEVLVGPKEAAGLPKFLKALH